MRAYLPVWEFMTRINDKFSYQFLRRLHMKWGLELMVSFKLFLIIEWLILEEKIVKKCFLLSISLFSHLHMMQEFLFFLARNVSGMRAVWLCALNTSFSSRKHKFKSQKCLGLFLLNTKWKKPPPCTFIGNFFTAMNLSA